MTVQRAQGDTPKVVALLALQRSANFVQLGLLFFLFIFCRLFGMTWRHYVFGIASGFVLMSAIITAAAAIRGHMGPIAEFCLRIIEPLGFTLGVIIWTHYFASAKSRVRLDHVPGTERLIAWNQALGEMGRR